MKSEKEKMLAGEPYLASNAELLEMQIRAQTLVHELNLTAPAALEERRAIIRSLFGAVGSNFEIRPPFFCDYGSNIFAGDNLFINFDCVILDCNVVRLGNNVLIGPKVQIYTAYHPLEPGARRRQIEMAAPVAVGDDVWIGGGAILCPGVEIGAGTTIGAGSVVTKSIPAGVVAAGNPCRVIKTLQPAEM